MKSVSYNRRDFLFRITCNYTLPKELFLLNEDDVDSVCLQEMWFTKQDIGSLDMLSLIPTHRISYSRSWALIAGGRGGRLRPPFSVGGTEYELSPKFSIPKQIAGT